MSQLQFLDSVVPFGFPREKKLELGTELGPNWDQIGPKLGPNNQLHSRSVNHVGRGADQYPELKGSYDVDHCRRKHREGRPETNGPVSRDNQIVRGSHKLGNCAAAAAAAGFSVLGGRTKILIIPRTWTVM
ncbi:hypothetical protein B0H16DRAFT_1458372 [Mycena metata]|uniref:Uncharacterized protein n=1 Tax=Mycena metata TaxID=1033252 RepID=A0AAD7NE10_9AGAR|nr:hypothetical protein B0H16DRAFT_1458372 [Mycena metata]